MRMSTGTGRVPPTRSMTRSWMARSSLACRRTSISEISSSSSVPPVASSNLPMRRATAPVKAPFSWPNSSLSSRFSGIAAQLIEMNGFFGAVGAAVQVFRHHLLAGAALAGDQHGGIGGGDLVGELDDPRHGGSSRQISSRASSATAAITAAISSASGGSGMYSLAPARMALTAARALVSVPQATTGTWMRSASSAAISPRDVEHDVDQQQVGAAAGAQHGERVLDAWRRGRPWRRRPSRSWSRR